MFESLLRTLVDSDEGELYPKCGMWRQVGYEGLNERTITKDLVAAKHRPD